MNSTQSDPIDMGVIPALESIDIQRRSRRKKTSLVLPVALGIGALAAAGAGFGAYQFMADRPEAPRAKSVRIGPLPEMPEIRDGVPALVTAAAGRKETGAAAPGAEPAPPRATPVRRVEITGSAPADAAPPGPPASAAKAMELTVAAAPLRPALPGGRPEVSRPAEPAPGVAPSATLSARGGIDRTASTTAAGATAAMDEARSFRPARDAAPDTPPGPPPARAASLAPPAEQLPNAAEVARPVPLPPARPAARSAEAAPAADRAAPARPRPGSPPPSQANPAGAATPAGPARATPPTAAAPPAEERAQVFGLRLPGFVPTGREIQDAASGAASTVAGALDSLNPF